MTSFMIAHFAELDAHNLDLRWGAVTSDRVRSVSRPIELPSTAAGKCGWPAPAQ